ncbi:hypothetical protein PG994_007697 [Apiospora phragmitis]|uniref:Uncharacterized protein n=1 Tax=Apiospora phragmitis TaxID=2905665 RepID=A0ABR1UQX8_9PEZI
MDYDNKTGSASGTTVRATPAGSRAGTENPEVIETAIHQIEAKRVHWYSYLATADFWMIVLLGQILALCITGTNTFSTLLVNKGTSIPAFQTLFNYVLLTLVYLSYTIYQYGFKKWGKVVLRDGWKYAILSFLDVEGELLHCLGLSLYQPPLLNFWSIVCVVIISFALLKVRYKWAQIAGILVACGGMGILLASDHIQGSNGGPGENLLKGDLFGLAGATLYGLSNVFEEWFVSKRPVYEVLSFLGLFGIIVNGVTGAIFDRTTLIGSTWDGDVAGYLVGYTLVLFIFYSLAPFILRMGSAAFFDISLLTGNFWGTIIGIHVFGYAIHFMYPIAFVCIIIGLVVYFLAGSMLGDSKKPWLGDSQADGVVGFGTAKLKALNLARKQGLAASDGDRI